MWYKFKQQIHKEGQRSIMSHHRNNWRDAVLIPNHRVTRAFERSYRKNRPLSQFIQGVLQTKCPIFNSLNTFACKSVSNKTVNTLTTTSSAAGCLKSVLESGRFF